MDSNDFWDVYDACPKNPDGSVDEKRLIDDIAASIALDVEEEKRKRAASIVREMRREGRTPSEGSLMLPGLDSFCWEPRRMVKEDDSGQVIEQAKALPNYMASEARRKRKNAQAATRKADRAQELATRFAEWCLSQPEDRRRMETFVMDTGIWQPEEVAPDIDEDDAEVA